MFTGSFMYRWDRRRTGPGTVADAGLDKVFVYKFADGKLTANDPPFAALPAKAAPRHFSFHPSGRYAYVMDGDIAVRTPISLGATSVSAVEILDGLQPGDRVVIAGTDNFQDAERVAVNN